MRTGKLYLKFFLSFLALLVITELMIFALFHEVVVDDFFRELKKYVEADKVILTDLMEKNINEGPVDITRNQALRETISKAGRVYEARIWVASKDGQVLVKSFAGTPPAIVSDNIVIHYGFPHYEPPGGPVSFYITFPLKLKDGQQADVYVLMAESQHRFSYAFALGLAGIGLVIALLIFLIYRSISEPLRELRHTALEIAGGDLSHRAEIASRDEIGELAGAFNHMAGIIEGMIKTNRELTANISHELRSPMARIGVAVELLGEKLADPAKAEYYLASIREEIAEMDALVGQFLTLSKLDIVEPMPREDMDLEQMVNHLLEHFAPSIEHKGIRLSTGHLPGPCVVKGHPDEIHTALSNVMDNAVKYTPEGGEIAVDMVKSAGLVHLSIRNICARLRGDEIDRLCEPFFRAEGTAGRGTGLGLAITRKIVARHGGTLKASPWVNGLAIEITLPLDNQS